MSDYSFLRELIAIDSPSGFTHQACDFVFDQLRQIGCHPERTNKGAVSCSFGESPKLAIAAHVDTLGAIVAGVNADGTLRFSLLGGLSLTGAEGEYVRIRTLDDKTFTGTILLDNPSAHANREKDSTKRGLHNMHVRLDEEVFTRYELNRIGIGVGDFICLNPRYEELPSGFIKSPNVASACSQRTAVIMASSEDTCPMKEMRSVRGSRSGVPFSHMHTLARCPVLWSSPTRKSPTSTASPVC